MSKEKKIRIKSWHITVHGIPELGKSTQHETLDVKMVFEDEKSLEKFREWVRELFIKNVAGHYRVDVLTNVDCDENSKDG